MPEETILAIFDTSQTKGKGAEDYSRAVLIDVVFTTTLEASVGSDTRAVEFWDSIETWPVFEGGNCYIVDREERQAYAEILVDSVKVWDSRQENEMSTDLSTQCEILAEIWMDYREDEGFTDFIEYNDLGLPLAYAVTNGIVEMNSNVERYIEETFLVLLSVLKIKDKGFKSLNDLLEVANKERS